MQSMLNSNLREKAGSDSYNRYEYQAHWIVYHMIQEYKNGNEFIIFCEFHDDMTKTKQGDDCAEFFQIKTSEKFKEWTFSRLFYRTKKKDGSHKNSFLGFIFYNFLNFKNECSKCHFVSNIGMDKEVSTWQSIIEDGKELKKENIELYQKIRQKLLSEYEGIEVERFDNFFEIFVQNTFIYQGNLSLENYEKIVAGEFFQTLENEHIFISNSNKILRDIIDEVRKKSKTVINTPISYNSLIRKKGVSSEVFSKLKQVMSSSESISYTKLQTELSSYLKPIVYKLMIRTLKKHHQKILDIDDLLYQETTLKLEDVIDEVLIANVMSLDDASTLLEQVKQQFNESIINKHPDFNEILVEAIFYEKTLEC